MGSISTSLYFRLLLEYNVRYLFKFITAIHFQNVFYVVCVRRYAATVHYEFTKKRNGFQWRHWHQNAYNARVWLTNVGTSENYVQAQHE